MHFSTPRVHFLVFETLHNYYVVLVVIRVNDH